ncbi:hypothetical protein IMSAG025_00636 [Muribaculaceae bacterium]|nr:hypothetical protein IMSAG025_00636 [Muribaculaceae bacterium]
MGTAKSPPEPAPSMMIVTLICGLSAGAKPVNQAWESSLTLLYSAEPVFPAAV